MENETFTIFDESDWMGFRGNLDLLEMPLTVEFDFSRNASVRLLKDCTEWLNKQYESAKAMRMNVLVKQLEQATDIKVFKSQTNDTDLSNMFIKRKNENGIGKWKDKYVCFNISISLVFL